MLIKCPNCSIRYEIPEEIGVSEGRKLKCSGCGHVFLYHASENSVSEDVPPETTMDPVLPADENTPPESFPVFLNENNEGDEKEEKSDVLTETFTPVETSNNSHKGGYRLSWLWILIIAIIIAVLGTLGFYYSDFLTTDYLLGMNDRTKSEVLSKKESRVERRNKVQRQLNDIKTSVVDLKNKATESVKKTETPEPVANTKPTESAPVVVNVPERTESFDTTMDVSVPEVVEETQDKQSDNSATEAARDKVPMVQAVYFDTEDTPNSRQKRVRIRGTLVNPAEVEIVLPSAVRAVAFDSNGKELFQKEIFLTSRFLEAGETQDFFGSYMWTPATDSVQIQWVDVGF